MLVYVSQYAELDFSCTFSIIYMYHKVLHIFITSPPHSPVLLRQK